MDEHLALSDEFDLIAGRYARLLVLLELTGIAAVGCDEGAIAMEISVMETAARQTLHKLICEVQSR